MSSSPIPLVLIGDAPTQPSGLARLARDLGTLIYRNLGQPHMAPLVQLLQIGLQGPQGAAAWAGPWPLVTFSGHDRMGAPTLDRVLSQHRSTGIVFALWDAHFSSDLLEVARRRGWDFWIYPPVDAVNQHGGFGGPAAEVVKAADRVLAYGSWSAVVLTTIRGEAVDGIPPGISEVWQPAETPAEGMVVGCVATNQPRKDLNLYFATIAELIKRGHDLSAWLVTDALVKRQGSAWAIPELIRIHGLEQAEIGLFTNAHNLGDREMVGLYQRSTVTIAPGCGEGFGYPIVESLACGVRTIAVDYAGGAELGADLVRPYAWRVDGPYALERPLVHARDIVGLIERLGDCPPNPVERYRWPAVWPQWEAWLRDGIAAYSIRREAAAGVL